MRGESIQEHKAPGEQYREMVQLYIKTLLECIPTPENPGTIYEYLHFHDQPVDLSIFEKEKKRRLELRAYRASVGGNSAMEELPQTERKSLE